MSDPTSSSPYGQPHEQPHQQPHEQPYAQQPVPPGQPYGAPSPYTPELPRHPNAGTALALGIIGLVGSLIGIGLLVSPFAWFFGGRAVREIDREPGRWSGRDQAQAGRVMGIIGTVLLVLGILLVVAMVVLTVAFWPEIQQEIERQGRSGNVSV